MPRPRFPRSDCFGHPVDIWFDDHASAAGAWHNRAESANTRGTARCFARGILVKLTSTEVWISTVMAEDGEFIAPFIILRASVTRLRIGRRAVTITGASS